MSRSRARATAARRAAVWTALALLAAACGSGGDGGDRATALPSSTHAARCASPRAGTDPATGQPYPDRQGTAADEKAWVRSWIDDLYLWYPEVPPADPAAYPTPVAYFDVLKTPAVTPSGRPKDQFHFTVPTAVWQTFAESGVEVGYGVQWVLEQPPPRRLVAAHVEPGSPGALAGLARGAEVVAIDGVDLAYGSDVATLNAGLSPAAAGETHTFVLRDGMATRSVALTSAAVRSVPVPVVRTLSTASGTVGYLLFNDHVATAEIALADAVRPQDNCGTTYFAIQFRGVNEQGFGDYGDGFTPGGSGPGGVPGCPAPDDLGHALGDPAEARLAAALRFRATGSCLGPDVAHALVASRPPAAEGRLVRPPWRETRVVAR